MQRFLHCPKNPLGLPGGFMVKNLPTVQEMQVQSLGQEDPQEEGMVGTSHARGAPMNGGAWQAPAHGVAYQLNNNRSPVFLLIYPPHQKKQTPGDHWLLLLPPLEKEMGTHSSVLGWRIPGMVEPSGLPSVGSQSRTWLKRCSSSSSSSIVLPFPECHIVEIM